METIKENEPLAQNKFDTAVLKLLFIRD